MKKPAQSTAASFCDLVLVETRLHGLMRNVDVCDKVRISTKTWQLIIRKKIPDLKKTSSKSQNAWIRTITRFSQELGLDLDACLEACGLEKREQIIAQAVRSKKAELSGFCLTESDLTALLGLASRTKKSIPVRFAMEYLSFIRNGDS
jgi:hypothetical protein